MLPLIRDQRLAGIFRAELHVLSHRAAGVGALVVRARVGVALHLLLAVLAPPTQGKMKVQWDEHDQLRSGDGCTRSAGG